MGAIRQSGKTPTVKELAELKVQVDGLPTVCITEANAWNANPEAVKQTQGKITPVGANSIVLDGNKDLVDTFDGKDE
jgi:hypothetical protein